MPYITKERRSALERTGATPENAGELNYMICQLIHDYIENKGLEYQTLNDVVGVLDAVKQELYRRLIGPYEDKKIAANGDIPLFQKRS